MERDWYYRCIFNNLKIKIIKKLSRISLGKLYQDDMAAREMNMLRGGNNCGCSCSNSLISKSSTYDANWACNFVDNGSEVCSWEGSGDVTVYGGNIVP